MQLTRPSISRTWLPLALAGLALIGLNLGLYLRLAPPHADTILAPLYTLPYAEAFAAPVTFRNFSGDWAQRDEALIQMSPSGYDLGTYIPIRIPADQPYQFAADLRYLGGNMGGGLLFNAQQDISRQATHMFRFNVGDDGNLYIVYGYFADDSNFVGQGSVLTNLLRNDPDWHRLGVNVGAETYQVTLDGAPVAGDIPLVYKGGGLGMITSTSQVGFDNLAADVWAPPDAPVAQLDPTAAPELAAPEATAQSLTAGDVIFADDFDNPAGTGSIWTPVAGTWGYQDGAYVQTQPEGFDLFASNDQVFSAFTFDATFRHLQGKGGGVMFNLTNPGSKNGAHLVRYVDNNEFLMWGYFDETGAFVGQGSVSVPDPGTDAHTLSVSSDGTTYAVRLDGAELAAGVPLFARQGAVGLAAAQSVVAFDRVEVRALQAAPTAEATVMPTPPPTEVDFNGVSGTWVTQDGVTIQSDAEATDYFAGTGIAGESYRVSVNVKLSAAPDDAGGGIVFHMAERDNHAFGAMVRFANGGNEIFWGSYTADRVFVGLGGAGLDLDWSVAHRLTIDVMAGSYSISVDDEPLVNSVPLDRASGWIGLVSFRGPVSFSEFTLTMPEA
ncbi:MAG: hypothetical protein IPO91_31790 [Chloroflexi bacterium]|nr:hypothetical protein [Chloroflexota bacterium]